MVEEDSEMREGGTEKTGLHARGGDGGSGKLESGRVRGEKVLPSWREKIRLQASSVEVLGVSWIWFDDV